MILYTNKADCCGCSACMTVCPHDAISMIPDDLGFLYPEIDSEKCVECGLCKTVCSFNSNYCKKDNFEKPIAYAVRHKDITEVDTSRSGAMFIALSDWILDNGGAIYGVGYVDHFRVVHKRATTKEERNEFKGSKYVQSDMNSTFKQVKADLEAGITVLFSGTPCQTSGLRSSLLNTDVKNLFVCDIVCHGVPSPYIWRDYLLYLETKYKNQILKVNFREKTKFGWSAHKESYDFSNKHVYANFYTNLFYEHITLRHSCGICHYTNLQHPSDITLADFWGWEKTDANLNLDDKGISLVLVNTTKGQKWFEAVKNAIDYKKK